ncbi:hypothetical protein AAFF_G00070010 [Aldrovandia affinis]|uniref:Uncharacterized protein n=1 Tax=Aldrovandia affinis TaxID=143900 RepID=A0AAD7RZ01_9TELE|nr:hypothetical protein AAFF_G00070010 [Aldrovandia affinis]
MSTELDKAMEDYEEACTNLKEELAGLLVRLSTLSQYQRSLLTTNTLLTSWLQNAEKLWKHRRQTRLVLDS